ncbi:PD-(D/E)XK nuclease family transposase, partial [Enterococcus sp. 669A]
MKEEIKVLPTMDLLFRKLLCSKDSTHILKAFVRDILGKEFKTLKPRETYHIDSYKKAFAEDPELMRTEVDILAETEDGSHVTIEMQIQSHDYFIERALFYLFEAFRSTLGLSLIHI